MLDKSCLEFIDMLESKAPVPGGGGACALVGAIGIALGSMVGNLTIGKKRYADVELELQALLKESEILTKRICLLVQKDAEVFEPLSFAYGLPANTEIEKLYKENVLQDALIQATEIPIQIAECSLDGIKLLERYAEIGGKLVVSDAGVGVILCKSALQGAKLCVLINLKTMKNEELKNMYGNKISALEAEGIELADQVYKYVEGLLCC